MKLGVIQSNYIPWRGYFDFIRSVDLFILHDDLQYTKQDWRNRNKIKTPEGTRWLTVPVGGNQGPAVLIQDTEISRDHKWIGQHCNLIQEHYRKAPFFERYFPRFGEILKSNHRTLSQLNFDLIQWLCGELSIATPIRFSSEYHLTGAKTERLIDLAKKTGATSYLSGPAAKSYLDEPLFEKAGVKLEYKTYNYSEYPQLYGPFEPSVTVLDLLMNCGPESCSLVREVGQ